MAERIHTETLPKAEAVRLYQKEVLAYRTNQPLHPALPNATEINSWSAATLAEAERRLAEIASSPASEFQVEMYYNRPRDIINFHNRLCGDEEI